MLGSWAPPGADAGNPADEDEVPWLIAREVPRLRRYARSLLGDPTAADDLVQDCLERALRKRHLWQRRGTMRGWLLRILYNLYVNALKGRRRERSLDEIGDAGPVPTEPARQIMRVELREMVEALDRLPAEQREAILLVVLEGVSYDEAASVLGVPIGTVRSRLARGRRTLFELRRGRQEVRQGGARLRRVK
jgi:RNA polymerase sigma-70 factor, ECF subfamily